MKRFLAGCIVFLAVNVLIAGLASACLTESGLFFRITEGAGGWRMGLLKSGGYGDSDRNRRPGSLASLNLGPYMAGKTVTAPFRLDYTSLDGKLTASFGPNSFSVITGFAGSGITELGEYAKASGRYGIEFSSVLLNGEAIPGVAAGPGKGKGSASYATDERLPAGDLSLAGILTLANRTGGSRHGHKHGHREERGDGHGEERGHNHWEEKGFEIRLGDARPAAPQVPIPSSLLLVASGAAGLTLARKKGLVL
jgi:hypothetical protein